MEQNVSKCRGLRFYKGTGSSPVYYLIEVPLESASSFKCLEDAISDKLTWTLLIEFFITENNGLLGYGQRNYSSVL